ncbi:Las1-domain-containing protein [Aureobasidium pullulans]|uniref:Las1-domain-containing protein n=1 Tax=Aureobasidium pullulans TaxID=5580 RepID=A0A4S8VQW9_AURPU|nr:Las1-domain-containing protein [Aureobasidium pullulans]
MPPQSAQRNYFVTPWRSHADLLNVRHGLYSPSTPAEQSHAIATVAAWKHRGNVPHAVESTALLMDAMLLHSQFSSSSAQQTTASQDWPAAGTASSFALRAAYTTALSRFVTGFADLGRHRNGPGQSMFDVARSIGLPPHFVELRHEVAHEDLPGLARLVRSAREAVNWLWGVYWAKLPQDAWEAEAGEEAAAQVDLESLAAVRQEATEYLKKFRSRRVTALKSKAKAKDTATLLLETQQQCQNLCCGEDEAAKWTQVASILIDDGLIVPSLKQTRGPLADSALQGAYLIWDELLIMLASGSSQFTEAFFERAIAHNAKLTTTNEDRDRADPTKWAMYRWIMHVLDSDAWLEMRGESPILYETLALRECVLHPNTQWSHELAEEILEDAEMDVQTTWKSLIKASALPDGHSIDVEEEASKETKKTDDVKMEDVPSEQGWRRETGAWECVPIGTVSG